MLMWTCWGFSVTKYEAHRSCCFLVENLFCFWKAKRRESPLLDVHLGEAWVPICLNIYASSSSGVAWDQSQDNLHAVGKPSASRTWLYRSSLRLLLGRTIYFVFSDKKAVFNIGHLVPQLLYNEKTVYVPRHVGFTGKWISWGWIMRV